MPEPKPERPCAGEGLADWPQILRLRTEDGGETSETYSLVAPAGGGGGGWETVLLRRIGSL
jgi:hypothetical protein